MFCSEFAVAVYQVAEVAPSSRRTLLAGGGVAAGGALPRDLLVEGDTLYVLGSTRPNPRNSEVQVFATKDLTAFTEVLHFIAPTFARSFARLQGASYFGLGCDPDNLVASTGRIFRVRR